MAERTISAYKEYSCDICGWVTSHRIPNNWGFVQVTKTAYDALGTSQGMRSNTKLMCGDCFEAVNTEIDKTIKEIENDLEVVER